MGVLQFTSVDGPTASLRMAFGVLTSGSLGGAGRVAARGLQTRGFQLQLRVDIDSRFPFWSALAVLLVAAASCPCPVEDNIVDNLQAKVSSYQ